MKAIIKEKNYFNVTFLYCIPTVHECTHLIAFQLHVSKSIIAVENTKFV